MASMYPSDRLTRIWNEVCCREFYRSGQPETTPKYPIKYYIHPNVTIQYDSEHGEHFVCLRQAVTDPGEMLLAENSVASCKSIRRCSEYTESQSTHAPTTLLSPPWHRIPREARQHMAHEFAQGLTEIEAFRKDKVILYETLVNVVSRLDARPHPSAVNPEGGMNPASSPQKRGPWNEVTADVEKTLNDERVWNIIANNAHGYEVSKSRESSQEETYEFWGMWLATSFINHSCSPNCHAARVGNAIVIRAARAIGEGEQLTLPYFDIFQPLCKRQLAAWRWGFKCACTRCKVECLLRKPYEAIQGKIMNAEKNIQEAEALEDKQTHDFFITRFRQDLGDLISPTFNLVQRLRNQSEDQKNAGTEIPYIGNLNLRAFCIDCIWASFCGPLKASCAILVKKAYEDFVPGSQRRLQAERLREVISCADSILRLLKNVHPGNLVCQQFYRALLKATEDLMDKDLDDNFNTA